MTAHSRAVSARTAPRIIVRKVFDASGTGKWAVFDYWDVRICPTFPDACARVREILHDERARAWPSA